MARAMGLEPAASGVTGRDEASLFNPLGHFPSALTWAKAVKVSPSMGAPWQAETLPFAGEQAARGTDRSAANGVGVPGTAKTKQGAGSSEWRPFEFLFCCVVCTLRGPKLASCFPQSGSSNQASRVNDRARRSSRLAMTQAVMTYCSCCRRSSHHLCGMANRDAGNDPCRYRHQKQGCGDG